MTIKADVSRLLTVGRMDGWSKFDAEYIPFHPCVAGDGGSSQPSSTVELFFQIPILSALHSMIFDIMEQCGQRRRRTIYGQANVTRCKRLFDYFCTICAKYICDRHTVQEKHCLGSLAYWTGRNTVQLSYDGFGRDPFL